MSARAASDHPGPSTSESAASGPRSTDGHLPGQVGRGCACCCALAPFEIEFTRVGGRVHLVYVCREHLAKATLDALYADRRGQVVTTVVQI